MLNHITMFQPSAIDNALSTMQILHKLINQINIIIDEINNIDSKANQYTDEQIEILKDFTINKINSDIESLNKNLKEYIDTSDKNLDSRITEEVEKLNTTISEQVQTLLNDIENLKIYLLDYINLKDNEIYVKIDEVYKELYDLIIKGNQLIYSPVTGELTNIQKVLYDMMGIVKTKNGINWSNLISLCKSQEPDYVIWDSWLSKLKSLNRFKNWNALRYYGCMCLQESLVTYRGSAINPMNQTEFISLLSYDF